MPRRLHKSILLMMAFLFAVPCFVPNPGQAEVLMRCAGASPASAPCARSIVPVTDLTPQKAYSTLMACCRRGNHACAMAQSCAASKMAAMPPSSHFSARRCLVTIHTNPAAPVPFPLKRSRWLLDFAPSLAPPSLATSSITPVATNTLPFWAYSPDLSPHAQPFPHGLRAPPLA